MYIMFNIGTFFDIKISKTTFLYFLLVSTHILPTFIPLFVSKSWLNVILNIAVKKMNGLTTKDYICKFLTPKRISIFVNKNQYFELT